MIFHPNFNHPRQYIHHKLLTREGRVVATGWTHPSSMTIFVHLCIRGVIWKVTIVTLNTIWHEISHLVKYVARNERKRGAGPPYSHSNPSFIENEMDVNLMKPYDLSLNVHQLPYRVGQSPHIENHSMRAVCSYNDWSVSIIKCHIYICVFSKPWQCHTSPGHSGSCRL